MTFTLLLATTALLTVFYFKSDAVRFGVKSDSGEAVQVAQYSPSEGYQLPPIGSPVPSPVFPNPTSDANLPVRKNAVDLTPQEKAAFVRAIDTLKNTIPEGSPISVYDQLALKHVLVMGCEVNFAGSGPAHGFNHAHGLPAFLPWHRQLVREFEQGLQAIDPNVTVPYWDWTDPKALDVILRDDFLGTNGTGVKVEIPGVGTVEGRPVPSSPFADWTLNEAIHIEPINLSSMGPKLLRFAEVPPLSRSFITPEAVKQLFTIDNYEIFSNLLEGDHSLTPDGQIVEDRRLHSYAHALAGGAFVKLAIDLLETAVDIQVETPSSPLWQRIRQLCLHRANPICRLSQEVVSIWLEFDLEQEHSNLPIPSIFLSLQEGQFQYLNGDTPTFCCWLTEKAIEPLLGHTVPFRLQQNFRSCLEALPITAQVLYLGVLLPQQSETIRIYISCIFPLKLVEYLTQIG